jgi:hypothetical protein
VLTSFAGSRSRLRGGPVIVVLVLAASLSPAVFAAISGIAPPIPKSARYTGTNSQGKTVKIFVSKKGKRVGYTMFVDLPCANGAVVSEISWTTEGQFYDDYWIRPRRDGRFALNSSNSFTTSDGGRGDARAEFKGRFRSKRIVAGTFRGRIDYVDAAGNPWTSCDTSLLTWLAKKG